MFQMDFSGDVSTVAPPTTVSAALYSGASLQLGDFRYNNGALYVSGSWTGVCVAGNTVKPLNPSCPFYYCFPIVYLEQLMLV